MTTAVCDTRAAESRDFAEDLLREGLLVPTGTLGVWGLSGVFDSIVSGIERLIDRETENDRAVRLRFPPVIGRAHFERSEFLKSFPHLAGAVYAFRPERTAYPQLLDAIESGGDWCAGLEPTDVVLVPAACYAVYPTLERSLPAAGRLIDVSSYCFRHEPSVDPARLIAFRMREQVRAGTPDQVIEFRTNWLGRAERLFAELGVPAHIAEASDPFFGRGGRLLAQSQREQRLKLELVVSIHIEAPTAVMSFNYHQDHFGRAFGIACADGAVAHTACVGFGLERIALSLLKTHGLDPARWPDPVRTRLFA